MSGDRNLDEIAALLRIMGHASRLLLLNSLIAGERSVGDLEGQTGIGQPTLSQQLGILRNADLVLTRRDVKVIYYRLNHDRMRQVCALLDCFAGTTLNRTQDPGRVDDMPWLGAAAQFARMRPAG